MQCSYHCNFRILTNCMAWDRKVFFFQVHVYISIKHWILIWTNDMLRYANLILRQGLCYPENMHAEKSNNWQGNYTFIYMWWYFIKCRFYHRHRKIFPGNLIFYSTRLIKGKSILHTSNFITIIQFDPSTQQKKEENTMHFTFVF